MEPKQEKGESSQCVHFCSSDKCVLLLVLTQGRQTPASAAFQHTLTLATPQLQAGVTALVPVPGLPVFQTDELPGYFSGSQACRWPLLKHPVSDLINPYICVHLFFWFCFVPLETTNVRGRRCVAHVGSECLPGNYEAWLNRQPDIWVRVRAGALNLQHIQHKWYLKLWDKMRSPRQGTDKDKKMV